MTGASWDLIGDDTNLTVECQDCTWRLDGNGPQFVIDAMRDVRAHASETGHYVKAELS